MSSSKDSLPLDQTLVDILASTPNPSAGASTSTLRARFTSPEITQYLSQLTSLPLPSLLQQPTELASEAAQLTNSLTSLCTTEYTTFLSLHRTSAVLSSSLDSLSSSLSTLLDALPVLDAQARSFEEKTREVRKERRRAALVLEHQDALVDVLDIPALIDTCVRNGQYQEALDLATHAHTLAARTRRRQATPAGLVNGTSTGDAHSGAAKDEEEEIEIVRAIADEAEHALHLMRAQLLAQLRAPAKLPALYKAVSFLRKLDAAAASSDNTAASASTPDRKRVPANLALDEPSLALAFLTGRLVYLDDVLSNVGKAGGDTGSGVEIDHGRFLRRYVDAWREGVADLVSQYTSIFLDPARAPVRSSSDGRGDGDADADATHATLHSLLATAASHLVHARLLPTLQTHLALPRASSSASSSTTPPTAPALPALLTQLTHTASSCARLGLDFRPALPPLFEHAVLARFGAALDAGVRSFSNSVSEATRWKRPPARWLLEDGVGGTGFASASATTLPDVENLPPEAIRMPPSVLATYRPIAELTNEILGALNALRLLAPMSLLDRLLETLEGSLVSVLSEFRKYAQSTVAQLASKARARTSEDFDDEQGKVDQEQVVRSAGKVLVRVLIPYARRALVEGVYGAEATPGLGTSLADEVEQWHIWLNEGESEGTKRA